jgi:hypothetical protein
MYWFSFGNKKGRGAKVQQLKDRKRRKSNVVIAALADWMVARGSVKDRK